MTMLRSFRRTSAALVAVGALALGGAACAEDDGTTTDPATDGGMVDGTVDGGTVDGTVDGGTVDGGAVDGGVDDGLGEG